MKKTFIKRSLPVDNYTIVETYSLAKEDYIICENCGKVIHNIAIVKDSKGNVFHVGLDCAATLSGINDFDIAYWSNGFNMAKNIRAKLNKARRAGFEISASNSYYDIDNITICYGNGRELVTEDFLKKYLPEIAKIAKVNNDFTPIKEESFTVENGKSYNGYTFFYCIKSKKEFWGEHLYAYAEIWKDGVLLKSGSNGGRDISSCIKECARLYNRVVFESGLHSIAV